MPVKQKLYIRKRADLEKKLSSLRAKKKQLRADEADLQKQIDELEEVTPEIEAQVEALEQQQTETDDQITEILDQLDEVAQQIEELGGEPAAEEDDEPAPSLASRSNRSRRSAPVVTVNTRPYRCRSRCFATREQRDAFYTSRSSHAFLENLRALAGSGRRSVKGAELNIPEEWLELLRDNLGDHSKLIRKIRLRPTKGKARQNVTGKIPNGIWTEAVSRLNELDFAFTQIEVDGFKVGGYVPLDNAILQDSDVDLGEEVMAILLYAIGQATDLAIVYGTGSKMPIGIVTRLAVSSQPSWWGPHQGAFTDLHSTNILKLNIGSESGVAFFKPLLGGLGKAKPNYTDGESFWVMNRTTHLDLLARALNFNAAGALVSGMNDRMPLENGEIIELEFMPDYELVGGFGFAYLLAERDGGTMATSTDVRFIEDQTVFKGTARYDGQPAIGEAFVLINYNNTDPTTSYDFEADYANTAMNVLICTAAAGSAIGKTVVTVAGSVADSPTLKYAIRYAGSLAVGDTLPDTGFESLTSGSTAITAAAGTPITVVELDGKNRVISAGVVISVPKTS